MKDDIDKFIKSHNMELLAWRINFIGFGIMGGLLCYLSNTPLGKILGISLTGGLILLSKYLDKIEISKDERYYLRGYIVGRIYNKILSSS